MRPSLTLFWPPSSLILVLSPEEFALQKAARRRALQDAQAALTHQLDRAREESFALPLANSEWRTRDLVVHLATTEAGLGTLARRIGTGEGGLPENYDPHMWNAGQVRRRGDSPISELRGELERSHAEMLAYLDDLDQEALGHRGRMPMGEEGSVFDVLDLVARHKREHTSQLEAALG
jgi:hypothetical protein